MNNHKRFLNHSNIDYNSLPYSGEHEAENDMTHKKNWGKYGKAFLRELAKETITTAIKLDHNWSGNIDRGQISCFLTNNARDKFVYISISDSGCIRGSEILYRTAEHDEDWTGGSNNFASLEDIERMKRFITDYLN